MATTAKKTAIALVKPSITRTIFVSVMAILIWILLDKVAHWNLWFLLGVAIGIVLIIGWSWTRKYVSRDARKKDIRQLHVTVGILVMAVILLILKDFINITPASFGAIALGLVSSGLFALAHHANQQA